MKFNIKLLARQPASASQRIAKNTGILYAKMGITMFISLYTTRLVLNALGASDFGIFGLVGGAIGMLSFLESAMASATQRFMSYAEGEGDKEKQKTVFNVSVILHILIAIVVAVMLIIAGFFFFDGGFKLNILPERVFAARIIYYFVIASTLFTIITVPYDAVLNAHENMLYYAIVGIIESLLKLTVAIIVVNTMADKLIVYGALTAGITFVVMMVMRIYCHRKYEECVFKPKVYFNKKSMKEMTGFAGWNFLGSSFVIISGNGSNIIINHFFGTLLNSVVALAGQFNGLLLSFANTMIKTLNPVIVKREGSGNREAMLSAATSGCKISFFLFAFFALPFLIETPYILNLWLKNDVPEWTITFCRLAIVQTLIEIMVMPLGTCVSAVGKIKQLNIRQSIKAIVEIGFLFGGFLFGMPPYWYSIVATLSVSANSIIIIQQTAKFGNLDVKKFVGGVVFKLFGIFVFSFLMIYNITWLNESFFRLLTTCLFSSVTFLLLFYFMALDSEEKKMIKNMYHTIYKNVFSNHTIIQ